MLWKLGNKAISALWKGGNQQASPSAARHAPSPQDTLDRARVPASQQSPLSSPVPKSLALRAPPPTPLGEPSERPGIRFTLASPTLPEIADFPRLASEDSKGAPLSRGSSYVLIANEGAPSTPPQSPSLFARGSKEHLDPESRLLPLGIKADDHYSMVKSRTGTYFMARRATSGSFSKGRYCFSKVPMFVKQVHFFDAGRSTRKKESSFNIAESSKLELSLELKLLQVVEPDLTIYDTVEVQDKYHTHWGNGLVMFKLMAGDGDDLAAKRFDQHEMTGRMLFASLLNSVKRCHLAGYIHHDFKLPNILWDDSGRFYLCDYGLAQEMDKATKRCQGNIGTWPAPEMFGDKISAEGKWASPEGYSAAVDLWALGMSIATYHANWRDNPFADINECVRRGVDPNATEAFKNERFAELKKVYEDYGAWRERYTEDGVLDVAKINPEADRKTRFYRWSKYFADVRAGDPELAGLILNELLLIDPTQRKSEQALLDEITPELAKLSDEDRQIWADGIKSLATPNAKRSRHLTNLKTLSESYENDPWDQAG